jgi:hypothetical protein
MFYVLLVLGFSVSFRCLLSAGICYLMLVWSYRGSYNTAINCPTANSWKGKRYCSLNTVSMAATRLLRTTRSAPLSSWWRHLPAEKTVALEQTIRIRRTWERTEHISLRGSQVPFLAYCTQQSRILVVTIQMGLWIRHSRQVLSSLSLSLFHLYSHTEE